MLRHVTKLVHNNLIGSGSTAGLKQSVFSSESVNQNLHTRPTSKVLTINSKRLASFLASLEEKSKVFQFPFATYLYLSVEHLMEIWAQKTLV
jgi:hypothetical protein